MVLTLPGRTHGLGLFTEPLLRSLAIDRESYGFMNLWATLLGALFCLPCGWLIDRIGLRSVYLAITFALGATVVAMGLYATGNPHFWLSINLPAAPGGAFIVGFALDLFLFLLLTRLFGQSALSVVSLAMIGKCQDRRSGLASGAFAVSTAFGFMGAIALVRQILLSLPDDWRLPWTGIGVAVVLLGGVGAMLIRTRLLDEQPEAVIAERSPATSCSLKQAILSPAFWTFSLAISFYGMVVAGTGLFNQSILDERGFDRAIFYNVTLIGIPFGLLSNLLTGLLASYVKLSKLMAVATAAFAVTLAAFPLVTTELQVYLYAISLALAGGAMTVCFYTVYRRAFGTAHLGSIQGIAQMLTVIFSAAGPLVFASTKVRLGNYVDLFPIFAAIALGLAVLTWLFGMPTPERSRAEPQRAPAT
jgi:MFS family permease